MKKLFLSSMLVAFAAAAQAGDTSSCCSAAKETVKTSACAQAKAQQTQMSCCSAKKAKATVAKQPLLSPKAMSLACR
jgi:hypothetical protein